nr:hypothetical protein [Tanacetum cinerariifolium]
MSLSFHLRRKQAQFPSQMVFPIPFPPSNVVIEPGHHIDTTKFQLHSKEEFLNRLQDVLSSSGGLDFRGQKTTIGCTRDILRQRDHLDWFLTLGWHLEEIHVTWGSFGEETDEITDLHQDSPRNIVLRAWRRHPGIKRRRRDVSDKNPIRTLGDYSKPSYEGYKNTIELPVGKNIVPLRSNTIWTLWTIKGVLSLDLSKVTITLQAKALDLSFRIQQVFRIQQYLQYEHYALWEVIEFGDSYKAPLKETVKDKGLACEVSASTKKKGRTVAITAEDMQKRKNDVKPRTTLLLALLDEHQLIFNKYDTAKELWEAIIKTFGGNEATKKTKKNQLKQQYGNFRAEGSETFKQTFNRLQAIVSHLEFMDVPIEQDDLNQKFLISLAPEWLLYTIAWRNRDDLNTMRLDDVYNHLKV